MDFMINDEKHSVRTDHLSITEALALKGITHSKGVAVAINQEIIPRSEWESHVISPNDHLLIITATQGG